ncbi:SufS family cysteine desulfurase [Mycobacterium sp. CBMA271]|uniref:family 2A encapsulin nanocompartment cargo protein cysteine desulfurase n=1 Tax=unclassified Mycobacteroides TaxID=2618759 RepID=UPI0012DE2548|nr:MULTISPECIES: family 2A encapsulin nanocompartment cargo protein cysteine desulfurase [unclassified Mycobacteroides]MUM17970.1 cysteine desulfurase [Mycobacteroides sp. CBMA 326]MUM23550.1 SufS family cysteine desulfurase [Mycobacteroides sp. CBMA 271]
MPTSDAIPVTDSPPGFPSAAELSALATQLFWETTPTGAPGIDTPGPAVPVAPRGTVPDATAGSSAAATAGSLASPYAPAPVADVLSTATVAPPVAAFGSGAPDGVPGAVPVAPRGGGGDLTSGTSAAHTAATYPAADVVDPFGIPAGLVPTIPGVLATPVVATAPSVPRVAPHSEGLTVPDLGWTTPVAPAGDDAQNYYFLGGAPAAAPTHEDARAFDVAAIRADFPILTETVNGKPLIWFDNAATTQKPQSVIDRLVHFYQHENSNIHRAAHELAARATDAYEDARGAVRKFLGAEADENIIFVRGATEAINLVAHAWGGKNLGHGDEIVITHLEHHANIVPWQQIAKKTGAVIKVAPVDDAGNLLLSELEDLVGPRTKLVAATQVSNALGTVTPAKQIVEIAHRYGARVLIDGAQSVPHLTVNLQELGADFFVFSGHKIYGPTGIGVLYGSEDALAETPPWQGGGNMIADVTLQRSVFQGPPNKFEAGTGNIADAVGLGEALRYVERIGIDRIAEYEHALLEYATPLLAAIPGVRLVGTADHKASVLSFVLDGHDPVEVGTALNADGIAVRAGHHCAQPILRRLGLEQTVRPSFAFYNTFDEIDVFIDAVRRLAEGGGPKA